VMFFGGITAVTSVAVPSSSLPATKSAVEDSAIALAHVPQSIEQLEPREAEVRPERRSRSQQPMRVPAPVRMFVPPSRSVPTPSATTLLAPPTERQRDISTFPLHAAALVHTGSLPPPPTERPTAVRRVLRALAFPFRQVGAIVVD
jgi:hypothetical protein